LVPYDVWAEIDLAAISENIKGLRRLLSGSTRLMAVVKADAYGHGAVAVSRQAIDAGADALGVARLGEALELRNAGISEPILILGHTPPELAAKLILHDLIQSVFSYQNAVALAKSARKLGGRIRVHVKIDTGMGRLGIRADDAVCAEESSDAVEEIRAIYELPDLIPEGIYTHFATADDRDKTVARQQFQLFSALLKNLENAGIAVGLRHAANSAATIDMPETHLDMVRTGISIYGHYPSEAVEKQRVRLIPAMSVKSRIVHLKTVGPDYPVSYGWTARTSGATTIATVAIGYADGLCRILSSTGRMSVAGITVPVIGRICMDHTMIDVGQLPEVSTGDPVVVFGNPATGALSAESVAGAMGTINYEVLTMVSGRVPRIFHR